jgi:hypothetical protein
VSTPVPTTRHVSNEGITKDPSGQTPEEIASIATERSRSESTTEDPSTAIAANTNQQQQINQLKTKQREQEKTIGTLKHKEVRPLFLSVFSVPPFPHSSSQDGI